MSRIKTKNNEHGFPMMEHLPTVYTEAEMIEKSSSFYQWYNKRRSVRDFSDKEVPKEIIENILLAASSAPSGAHKQPWTFVAVQNKSIKHKIRLAAEEEERKSYEDRMPDEWLEELKPIGTDWRKPFLETAPWLIVVFKRSYNIENGKKTNNYYVSESVGLASGFLLSAIHHAGLVSLTHTPSPMNFLHTILQRPENEKPFLLIPVGYPAKEVWVPDLQRKKLSDFAVFI